MGSRKEDSPKYTTDRYGVGRWVTCWEISGGSAGIYLESPLNSFYVYSFAFYLFSFFRPLSLIPRSSWSSLPRTTHLGTGVFLGVSQPGGGNATARAAVGFVRPGSGISPFPQFGGRGWDETARSAEDSFLLLLGMTSENMPCMSQESVSEESWSAPTSPTTAFGERNMINAREWALICRMDN